MNRRSFIQGLMCATTLAAVPVGAVAKNYAVTSDTAIMGVSPVSPYSYGPEVEAILAEMRAAIAKSFNVSHCLLRNDEGTRTLVKRRVTETLDRFPLNDVNVEFTGDGLDVRCVLPAPARNINISHFTYSTPKPIPQFEDLSDEEQAAFNRRHGLDLLG